MSTVFQTLSTPEELESAIARSSALPIVIFKHSPSCGISAQALESISEWLSGGVQAAEFYVLPVQASRPLSQALAQRFGIRHESPQVMVIDRGHVVWHGSHFRATAAGIRAALGKLAA